MRTHVLVLATLLLTAGFAVAPGDDGAPGDDDERRGKPDRALQAQEDRGGDRGKALREHVKDHFLKHEDKWVVQNDNITIWFHQGKNSKPALAVFRTGEDGNRSGFRLVLDELFEARADGTRAGARGNGSEDDGGDEGDDGPDFRRVRGHRINLHPAKEWWTSVENGTDEVTITMSHLFNQGNVTLVFHVPKASGPVKFDVLVKDWDWADPNNTLALRLKVLERGADQQGDAATFNGGWIRWADSASVTYPDGRTASIPVEGVVKNKGEGARILLRFNGTGGYSMLDYDPTIGVQGMSMSQVPGPGALAALGALGLAVAVATRRRRPPS
jgi:MYXO-CTERM domain-containing protein